jgi:hypothetical protein
MVRRRGEVSMKATIVEGDAEAKTVRLRVSWDAVCEPDGTLMLGKEIELATVPGVPDWISAEIRNTWKSMQGAGQTEAYRIMERMVRRLGYGDLRDSTLSMLADEAERMTATNPPTITEHDFGIIVGENRQMKQALYLARKWGVRSDGFSAEVANSIRDFIDRDFQGPAPKQPDYYPPTIVADEAERMTVANPPTLGWENL